MKGRSGRRVWLTLAAGLCLAAGWGLAACSPADPGLVARAVAGTLTAAPSQTPVVVVVTVWAPTPPPSATPAAAITLPPSPTPAPTATTPAGPAPTGAPALADDFSQPSGWTLGEDGVLRAALVDGQLELTVKEPDQFQFLFDTQRRAGDFYAELTGRAASACQPRDRYGLLFRVQDGGNYYQFEVDCAGRYRLAKRVAGQLTALKDWSLDPAILTGDGVSNTLGLRVQGARLEAWVNNTPVFQTTDAAWPEGALGLIVGSDPSSGFSARFDDLRVWVLR
ncbi:MAG: DUF1080 domain-containing protein [Anaerolineales bacterium]|nr:DUF1080 domain-containing protein [Anaerolineales bacterium]